MNPEQFWLALALWGQGLIVFGITRVLYQRRIPRVMAGKVKIADIALDKSNWPEDTQKAANAYSNQFELPMLFFVAGAGLLWLGVGWIEVVLAWGFVVSRTIHAFIHVTSNHVIRRFAVFAIGFFIIVALWVILGVRLVMAGIA